MYSRHEPELTRSLARAGHDVLAVDNVCRALRLVKVFRPDVVLLEDHPSHDDELRARIRAALRRCSAG